MRLIDADDITSQLWMVEIKGDDIDRVSEQIIKQCKEIVRTAPTINLCESCAWCEYEFVKSDGSEDKRYRNHKWCGLHKRSTKKDGFCHWHMEKRGSER